MRHLPLVPQGRLQVARRVSQGVPQHDQPFCSVRQHEQAAWKAVTVQEFCGGEFSCCRMVGGAGVNSRDSLADATGFLGRD